MLKDLLESRHCFKLVCGAGNEDVESVRRLVYVYALAGCRFFDLCASERIVEPTDEVSLYLSDYSGFTVKISIPYALKQVSEPKVYDNSKRIKQLMGVVDPNLSELYKAELGNADMTEELRIMLEDKYKEEAKYYIYDGTGRSDTKRNITPTKSSITSMAILENVHTEDSAHILKDFKELFNDLQFELELEEDNFTSSEKSESLKWIFKDYIPDYDWPAPDEIPILEEERAQLGTRPFVYVVSNNGGSGAELIAPGNCKVLRREDDYLELEFVDVYKKEIKQRRVYVNDK